MKNVICPICQNQTNAHSSKFAIKRDQIDFELIRCEYCQHHYTFFDQELVMESFYDEKDYQVRDTSKSLFYSIQKQEYQPVIRNIKKIIRKEDISLLDFGAGKGLFLNFATTNGLKVKGVETSAPRADYAIKYFNLKIDKTHYTEGRIFDHDFDVITLFHVLEHLEKPFKLLKNLTDENLSKNGLLIIEVPNFNSWQAQWAGKNWLHLDVPRHLSHFSPETLKQQLDELGFSIIKTEFFSWHLGIIGMIQTIWSWFGYRGFLIAELKESKTISLLLKILITLPFSIILEGIAALFKHGGMIRIYAQKNIA